MIPRSNHRYASLTRRSLATEVSKANHRAEQEEAINSEERADVADELKRESISVDSRCAESANRYE